MNKFLEICVCGLIKQGYTTGYDILQALKKMPMSPFRPTAANIYPILEKLATKKYVSGRRIIQHRRPVKIVYLLTPLGERKFMEWLSAPSAESDAGFDLKFMFIQLLPPETQFAMIDEYASFLARKLDGISNLPDSAGAPNDFYIRLSADREKRRINADLAWLSRVKSIIEGKK